MTAFEDERRRDAAELEAELAEKTGAIQGVCEFGGENFLEHARGLARSLANPGQPREFRLEGFVRLGIIDAFDKRTDDALVDLEECRRLAVDLADYERAAQAMGLTATVTEDADTRTEARRLQREYQAAAAKYGEPDRFRRFELDHD